MISGTGIYNFSQWLLGFVSLKVLMVLPVSAMLFIVLRQVYNRTFDLGVVFQLLVIAPALTPMLAKLSGFEYFTAMNHYLQRDDALIGAAILLISVFFFSSLVGRRVRLNPKFLKVQVVDFGSRSLVVIFFVNFFLLLFFLESDTILRVGYGVIKQSQAEYSSLVNQVFNLSVALVFASISTLQKRKLVQVVIILFIVLSLLFARRTLAIGLLILLAYTFESEKLRMIHILVVAGVVFALWFIGEARTVGVLSYLAGVRSEGVLKTYYSMPGGGANVFIGTMGVIDLLGRGQLEFPQTMPMLLWLQGESASTIYPQMGYEYNGGMHIASVLYWNFGIFGVVLGGIVLGALTKYAGESMRGLRGEAYGDLGRALSIGFVLVLPNLVWYSPIGFVKLSGAIVIATFLLRLVVARKL